MFTSAPAIEELLDVIQRTDISRKFRFVGGLDIRALLSILATAEMVVPAKMDPMSRNPEDDQILATALAANADDLVTEDKDLLVLGSMQSVRIVTSQEFLQKLKAKPSSETM
jgi:putative PIN family toxin of toxin-antitoxin system